jgi:hypothetical protein
VNPQFCGFEWLLDKETRLRITYMSVLDGKKGLEQNKVGVRFEMHPVSKAITIPSQK